jgi:hypothetical protein
VIATSPRPGTQRLAPIFDLERDQLIRALSASLVDHHALDPEVEAGILAPFECWLFDLIELADSLAAKLAELQACQGRADRHVETHRGCRFPGCLTLGAIRQRIHQLERQVASEHQALKRGRR